MRGTMEHRVEEIRARLANITPGPWFVWDGVSYVGGGRDLCIGAGGEWMANMDHRCCVREREHSEAHAFCSPKSDADVCSLAPSITGEQEANANFIARAREDVPFLLGVIAELEAQLEREQDENFRLRHGDEMAARCGVQSDVMRMNRLEWADTVLICHEGEDDPQRRFSFRDMATPPTAEHPDGTIYGPTVRAVLDAALQCE